jgi:hypothetical protein
MFLKLFYVANTLFCVTKVVAATWGGRGAWGAIASPISEALYPSINTLEAPGPVIRPPAVSIPTLEAPLP